MVHSVVRRLGGLTMEPIVLEGVSASRGVPRQAEVSFESSTATVRIRLAGATRQSVAASVSRGDLAERLRALDGQEVRLPPAAGPNDLMAAASEGDGVAVGPGGRGRRGWGGHRR